MLNGSARPPDVHCSNQPGLLRTRREEKIMMLHWKTVVRFFSLLLLLTSISMAQTQSTAGSPAASPQADAQKGVMMLTIFLRHDESKTLDQINADLKAHGYFDHFPPKEVEVVSWYVMMGIGQVVTLRFPAERLREVNLSIERHAWGGFRTDFYPTYDYKSVWEAEQKKK
jgi:hypothetical protein